MKNLRVTLTAALLLAGGLFLGCAPRATTTGTREGGHGKEAARVQKRHSAALLPPPGFPAEVVRSWETSWKVEKYWVRSPSHPYAVVVVPHNLLCTAGITRMLNLLIAAGGQGFDATHSRIGTGNGVGTAAAGDTDLSAAAGSANRWFQVMDATYPSVATNVVTFKATFGTADGNYAWNEFGTDAGTASGNTVTAPLLNHKTSAGLGSKSSSASWVITETITLN